MSSAKKKSRKPGSELREGELRIENLELSEQLREMERIHKIREERREREYRMKYLSFINCIADPVFIYDAITYKFLHCNELAVENYGYSKEEILAMTPFDLHIAEDFEKVRSNIDKRIVRTSNTYTYLTKDRRERIVEITSTDIYFEGKPAWMSVVHDITDRTLMEEELHKYRFQLEEMVNERTIEVLLANKKLKQEVQERKKAELAIL
jgi:PAS domain S-box-containing protein